MIGSEQENITSMDSPLLVNMATGEVRDEAPPGAVAIINVS